MRFVHFTVLAGKEIFTDIVKEYPTVEDRPKLTEKLIDLLTDPTQTQCGKIMR